ncbi:MAG TPA: CCA tRNA nucleotidyltransferase [bacterium]|nr:CCA tRNA nucleotidyltransferase [bacterium]HPN32185.1 CCA tRNA nucleotidyltransferase [bacterium]
MNDEKKKNKDEAYFVVKKLIENKHSAYLAGGCVRDELLGLNPVDYDVATSATPEEISGIFHRTAGFAKKYGVTVVVLNDNITVEVTTFRKDFGYRDGRRPTFVEFGTIEEDYIRRDFTINAMYKDVLTGKIIDFSGGASDLKNKIVKCVGIPENRFKEDKLRIMRAIRFAGALNFTIESETKKAIIKYIDELAFVSKERIHDELTKMITKKNADISLKLLKEIGALKIILPELEECSGVKQPPEFHPEGDVFEHTLKLFENAEYPINKILAYSMLFHDVGKPAVFTISDRIRFNGHEKIGSEIAETVMKRLRFSNKDVRDIKKIVLNHMKFMNVKSMKKSTLKKIIFGNTFDNELALHKLDCLASHGNLENYYYLLEKRAAFETEKKMPVPFISGHDIINAGIQPSPVFKKILSDIYNKQLEGIIKTKEEGLDLVKEYIKNTGDEK